MIVIYADRSSARLDYVVQFIFEQYFGLPYRMLYNEQEFIKSEGFKINYSSKSLDADFHIHPYPDIYSDKVRKIEVTVGSNENFKTLFQDHRGTWGFDLFFAVFFLLSRYEEYWPSDRDDHGRFRCKNSILFKIQSLNTPWVNIWLHYFANLISANGKVGTIRQKKFTWIPTFDIDRVYAYKKANFDVRIGGILKNFLKGNTAQAGYRFAVITGKTKDPFDVYHDIISLHEDVPEKKVFFLTHQKRTGFDKNIDPERKEFKQVVKQLAVNFDIGLHPSYFSFEKKLLEKEKESLERVVENKIHISRFHFLKFNLPEYYTYLIKCGIREDFSMGYAECTGYRAGIASPFYFFDLQHNEATSLLVHPFVVMDVTLKNYMGLDPRQAIAHIKSLIEQSKNYGCRFITLWHNESLSDYGEWKGWRQVYETMASLLKSR